MRGSQSISTGPTVAFDSTSPEGWSRCCFDFDWHQEIAGPAPPTELQASLTAPAAYWLTEEVEYENTILAGDYYREPDQVVRSVSFAHPAEPDDFLLFPIRKETGHGSKSQRMQASRVTQVEIRPEVVPLADPLYHFSSTTLHLPDISPSKLWSLLQEFLRAKEADAHCWFDAAKLKVKAVHPADCGRQETFSELDDAPGCELKIRVYRPNQQSKAALAGGYVVEFRRMRGDAVSFSLLFMKAWEFLRARTTATAVRSGKSMH